MYSRNTYMEVYTNKIENNVRKIIEKYKYEYYFGVVKGDCYNLGVYEPTKALINAGCNYLAVATLEEAKILRGYFKEIPILCLEHIPFEFIDEALKENVTLTIDSLEYIEEVKSILSPEYKVHIKLDTGMNRLGFVSRAELKEGYSILKKIGVNIEGIYTHMYDANNKEAYESQIKVFEDLLNEVDLSKIKICHLAASETIVNYPKKDYENGCRLGIMAYGFSNDKSMNLESTFSLKSEVFQINKVHAGDKVGYSGAYTAKTDETIAVIPIGYGDGIFRSNTGRDVYINDKRYPIIGKICMDMMFVKIDDNVKLHDNVMIIKDNEHLQEIADYIGTIVHEELCDITKRVPRIYM